MTKFLIFIIKVYRYLVSPLLGSRCRFLPTCSEYFIEALKTQGLTMGIKLGVKRILKCHPFKKLGGSHGLDFVPIPKDKKVNYICNCVLTYIIAQIFLKVFVIRKII